MTRAGLIGAAIVCGIAALIVLFGAVHFALDRLCVRQAQRFCRRRGLKVCRCRWRPELEPSGIKTEFTLVQLDCLDLLQQRRLVLLSVWPFGVYTLVSDEEYPDFYDEQWPQRRA